VRLRAGTPADIDALETLELQAFTHDRLSRRSFARFLASSRGDLIVAEADEAVCGYVLILFRSRSGVARLYSIAVDAENAGHRIGSRLLEAAEHIAYRRGAKTVRLEVRERNLAARKLYRRFGYAIVDRLVQYYEDGSHALRLQKILAG